MISHWECKKCEMLFTSQEKADAHKCKAKASTLRTNKEPHRRKGSGEVL